jgi:hypothetical protein
MNINFSNVILLHIPVEEVRLIDVKTNIISAKSTTFKFRDADLQPYLTPYVSNFRIIQAHSPRPRSVLEIKHIIFAEQ